MSQVPGSRSQVSGRDLPRLCLIADGFVDGSRGLSGEEIRRRTRELVKAGVPWVQLRDHNASTKTLERETRRFVEALRRDNSDTLISVNGHPQLAEEIDAGVHVGRRGPSIEDALAVGVTPVGYSAHTLEEVLQAEQAGTDYVTFAPVFPTQTHPDAPSTGVDALKEAVHAREIPILALGGITPGRVQAVRGAGAYGVAVVSALLLVDDPRRKVDGFLKVLSGE